ncbi:ribosome biogenesis GTPase YlqF [Vampirovibrio chlorellavorus]|uniref:ribosome biogenesis GTPase YlqF n=1 Tax=Vampirovibrio chlorellavorus TaxID=758823 RepID=UPI0026F19334|nr:ribosome biogenesis GTPase YlqF [Vampirovibrio chlorellavorus]
MQQSDVITPKIQWYPGHIAKYERKLSELLKLVDVVVEVLDARLPVASVNHRLEATIRNKPTLIILNKSDLADPVQNKRWQKALAGENRRVMLYDAKGGQAKAQLIQHVLALGEAAMQKLVARGRKRRPVRVLVAGMPNVGKSTLINSIVGQKKTKTGHRAGVTRDTQWVRIHPEVELMDSPGVIPPQLDSDEAGALLATVSSIGDAAFDEEEIARFLIETIDRLYPGQLARYFKLADGEAPTLENMALARHYKLSGDQPDLLRTAQALLTEFRHARPGRITLEHAQHTPKEPESEEAECPPRQTPEPAEPPAEI